MLRLFLCRIGDHDTSDPSFGFFQAPHQNVDLKWFDDYIADSGLQQDSVSVSNAELVFVGYGIQAPEYQWNDFKGVDLKGKILGVQVSTTHSAYAKKHFADTAAEIKEYQTQDEANQDLAAGRIDATQADQIALEAFLASDTGKACCDLKGTVAPDIEVLGPGVGAGLRKEDTAIKDRINAAIKAIRDNGKYAEITKKYFTFDVYGG